MHFRILGKIAQRMLIRPAISISVLSSAETNKLINPFDALTVNADRESTTISEIENLRFGGVLSLVRLYLPLPPNQSQLTKVHDSVKVQTDVINVVYVMVHLSKIFSIF